MGFNCKQSEIVMLPMARKSIWNYYYYYYYYFFLLALQPIVDLYFANL